MKALFWRKACQLKNENKTLKRLGEALASPVQPK
jgi:hypothetical protein